MKQTLIRIVAIAGLLALLLGSGPVSAQAATRFETPNGEGVYALSPDGSMIAVAHRSGRDLCAYTVPDAELVNCVDLTEYEVRIDPVSISWSPASDAIAFSEPSTMLLIDSDIMLFDVSSGELTYLTDDGIADRLQITDDDSHDPFPVDTMPAWSPDGTTIAFSRVYWGEGADRSTSLMLLDVETNDVTELAPFSDTPFSLPFRMVWSPEGETVYSTAWFPRANHEATGVYAFSIETGEFTQLAGPNELFGWAAPIAIASSPAGDRLVLSYPEFLATNTDLNRPSGYALLDLASGDLTILEPSEERGGDDAVIVAPNFSTDGRSLIFGVRQQTQDAGLLIAREIDSGVETLIAELPDGAQPTLYDPSVPVQIGGAIAFVAVLVDTGYAIELPVELSGLAAPAATPESGGAAATIRTADVSTVLRGDARSDGEIIAVLPPGTELYATGQAFEANGHAWIEVMVIDTGDTGFVRTDFLDPVG